MRAAILNNGTFSVETLPDPEPEPNSVVLSVSACGLCGIDHSLYRGGQLPEGAILGHECAGTVVATGARVQEWKIGDRAAVIPIPYCGQCELCRGGQENLCAYGLQSTMGCGGTAGGLAELVAVPESCLRRLPEGLDPILGALVEPLAVAWRAVDLGQVTAGARVGILGLGPLGLFAGLIARQRGALVFGTDPKPHRVAWAHAMGLGAFQVDDDADDHIRELTRGGPEVVFEATGVTQSIQKAAQLARMGGRVILLASYHSPVEMTPGQWVNRGISLMPSIAYTRADFEGALEAISTRRFDLQTLVGEARPLSEVQNVFDSFQTQTETAKLVIDPSRP